ncbi:MAG TPA: hypothetical protein VIM73_01880 [Polyangiaceae bacterium]
MSDEREIRDHVRCCERCQRELKLLGSVQRRLANLASSEHDPALLVRAFARLDADALRGTPVKSEISRRWLLAAVGGWAAAAGFGALWVAQRKAPDATRAAALPPMVNEVLREYERARERELPAPRAADELDRALGHPIPYLKSGDVTLVSSWLTTIREESSAAIAYRYRERIVVQFVVSEALFLRQPVVRDAIARKGVYLGQAGAQGVVGRVGRGVGSLLVGESSPEVLERLLPSTG